MDVAGAANPFGAECSTTSGLGQMMKAAGKGLGQMLLISDPPVYLRPRICVGPQKEEVVN